ncbi:ABC transporter permease subunit [Corynebacterium sputi]|uniref:ABC transporter permease subunit n=1 Tax=Corynebacterium sputi TaxID=489915 RepID=UPI0004219B73|nr:ABC transporter permease subunit [Corynebacterium sputi]
MGGRFSGPVTAGSRMAAGAAVVLLIGMLPWLSRNSAEYTILRSRYAELEATPENLAAVREELGLDRGAWAIFGDWLVGIVRGDPGESWINAQPVLPGTMEALTVSLTLMGYAFAVAAVLATLLCLPAIRRGMQGRPSRGTGAAAVTMTALPEFLLAAVLLVIGSVWLGWFPPYGWRSPVYVVLPALALGIPAGGLVGRLMSDSLSAAFTERWVATWRMAGASPGVLIRAVLRRAVTPVLPQVGLVLIGLTGGAVAVEQVYSIPGLGRATLGAASAQDIPALQAGVLALLVLAVLVGALFSALRRLLLGTSLRSSSVPVQTDQRYRQASDLVTPVVIAVVLGAIIVAGLLRDPFTSAWGRLEAPGLALPFGADASSRDLLARVGHGALTTLGTAAAVVAICLVVGLVLGSFPRVSTGFAEMANAAPPIIAGLIVAAVWGSSIEGSALAVAAVSWAPLAAHTASLTTEARSQPHMQILPVLGAGPARIMFRYILPATIPPVARHAVLRLPGIALALAALGFLGLGPQQPTPEWGLILGDGIDYLERAWWTVGAPTLALVLASVLAVPLSALPKRGPKPSPEGRHVDLPEVSSLATHHAGNLLRR